MAANITITEAEAQVRDFATAFPTPNVLRGVELATAGRISWFQLYDLCKGAIVKARQEVSA